MRPTIADVDKVLICIGRKPRTGGIGLEKLEVELDDAGWPEKVAGTQIFSSKRSI